MMMQNRKRPSGPITPAVSPGGTWTECLSSSSLALPRQPRRLSPRFVPSVDRTESSRPCQSVCVCVCVISRTAGCRWLVLGGHSTLSGVRIAFHNTPIRAKTGITPCGLAPMWNLKNKRNRQTKQIQRHGRVNRLRVLRGKAGGGGGNQRQCVHICITHGHRHSGVKAWRGDGSLGGVDGGKGDIWNTPNNKDKIKKEQKNKINKQN